MTRAELHNTTGFHAPTLLAAALHLRTLLKRQRSSSDPSVIINNEGRINGYLDAIDDLIAATAPQPPDAPKKEYQAYAPPQPTKTENPNRP